MITREIGIDPDQTDVLVDDTTDYVLRQDAEWFGRQDVLLTVDFSVGRDEGVTENEDGPIEVSTTVHPDLLLLADDAPGVYVVALQAGPVVYRAFRTSEDLESFILQFVPVVHAEHEGIESASITHRDDEVSDLASRIREAVLDMEGPTEAPMTRQ